MNEFVIVIPDLYLSSDSAEIAGSVHATGSRGRAGTDASADGAGVFIRGTGSSSALPGLERIARFGRRRTLEPEGGWRPRLARALGRDDLADMPPAAIVMARTCASQPPASTVWLATPLHLIAGLTSLHLDRRSLLRLSEAEAEAFVAMSRKVLRALPPYILTEQDVDRAVTVLKRVLKKAKPPEA